MRRGVQTGRATLLVREKRSLRERERERKRDSHGFACRAFKLSDAIKSTSFLSPTHFVLIPTCTIQIPPHLELHVLLPDSDLLSRQLEP